MELNDMRTPLENIMKVFSVLLAIKSGTGAYQGAKASFANARKFYESAQQLVTTISTLSKYSGKLFKELEVKGLKVIPLACVSKPAFGYNGSSGPKGGNICPNVETLFATVESQFNTIRQKVVHLDLIRREAENISIGGFEIPFFKRYSIKYHAVDPLYKTADSIRDKARILWALATAINFANKNCTCGQSYCKLPLCISGAPLTPDAILNGSCFVVYALRPFLKKTANELENLLK